MGNKGEKTKEIIRQKAYRLFAEKGFQRVTQMAELILYYYQGLRMWSRVIPFGEQEGDNFAETIRRMLLRNDAP